MHRVGMYKSTDFNLAHTKSNAWKQRKHNHVTLYEAHLSQHTTTHTNLHTTTLFNPWMAELNVQCDVQETGI
jgi:hypothetical protein